MLNKIIERSACTFVGVMCIIVFHLLNFKGEFALFGGVVFGSMIFTVWENFCNRKPTIEDLEPTKLTPEEEKEIREEHN
jgi:hypothetical protein